MIQNNNTPDVAYLGYFTTKKTKEHILSKNQMAVVKHPSLWTIGIGVNYIFDCYGTRYGFRIKELKSK